VGPVLVVLWLVIVLPVLLFAGGFLVSVLLNAAVQKLSPATGSDSGASDKPDT
jgi:hypothetical protein